MSASRNNHLVRYFVFTYLLFWALLGITGALIALKTPPIVQAIMQNVCAWSPTFVIIMLFRKLYPNTTVGEYLKRNFLSKVNPLTFLLTLLIQVLIAALAFAACLLSGNAAASSLSFADLSTLPSIILITATSGPLGEELGWRGYALGEMQRRVSPFTATLMLGAVWGFWHTPLWMLSGYSGMKLAYYIIFFLVGIASTSVMMTVFYRRSKNILVPMWIHFLFNLLLKLPKIDLLPLLAYTSLGYLILAAVLSAANRTLLFRKPVTARETSVS